MFIGSSVSRQFLRVRELSVIAFLLHTGIIAENKNIILYFYIHMCSSLLITTQYTIQHDHDLERLPCLSTLKSCDTTKQSVMKNLTGCDFSFSYTHTHTHTHTHIYIYIYILLSVRQWPGRPGFSRRSSHTKDSKKGYLILPSLTLSNIR